MIEDHRNKLITLDIGMMGFLRCHWQEVKLCCGVEGCSLGKVRSGRLGWAMLH